MLLGSCSAYVLVHADDIFFSGYSKGEGLNWAGFHDLHGAKVTAYHSDCGIDCTVNFLLVGSASEVDEALADAGFGRLRRTSEPMSYFFGAVYPPDGLHPAPLVHPLVGKDTILNSGQHVYRRVVRSELPDGRVQLVVGAFDT